MSSVIMHDRVSFIKKAFGEVARARDGINVAVVCPSCNNKSKKKFSINLDTGQCHCWVCDLRGKTLIPILRKFDKSHLVSEYCEKFPTSGRSNNLIESDKANIEQEVSLPPGFSLGIDLQNSRDPDTRACLSYLKSRNVTERDMWHYKIGVANYGKFRKKVIFPSFDSDGKLNFFVARSIDKNSKIKYTNCDANKQSMIFNEVNINWKKELAIVEGPFDLIKSGYNSTCLLGARMSVENLLFSKIAYHRTSVLLCLDSDMSAKSQSIARLLSEYGCPVRILPLDGFEDVGEMTKLQFKNRKTSAENWCRNNFILSKIRAIESGSII